MLVQNAFSYSPVAVANVEAKTHIGLRELAPVCEGHFDASSMRPFEVTRGERAPGACIECLTARIASARLHPPDPEFRNPC
jgi:hypothetical protein